MKRSRPAVGYEAFVRESTVRLLRVAWLLTGDFHDAQDLVQETHVRMASRWGSITRHDGDPTAYARTVLHRIHIDQWRRRQRRPERLVDSLPDAGVADGTDARTSVNTVKSQARHAIVRLRQLNPQLVADLEPARTEA